MAEKYPVKWRGETYYASDLTDGLKFKYCQWLYGFMLDNARKFKTAVQYLEFDRRLTANPPEWTSIASAEVLESFKEAAGQRQILRLILDLDEDAMSDADLAEMTTAKDIDEASDLNTALKIIRENADPKPQPGEAGLPRPAAESEPLPPSAMSPSA